MYCDNYINVDRDPVLIKKIGDSTALEVRATGIQCVCSMHSGN